MDAKIKFKELKQAWIKASGEERDRIDREMDDFFKSLTNAEKLEVQNAVSEDFTSIRSEVENIKETLNLRDKIAPVLPAISVSYLAKHYFKRTPQWFYQRLNGNNVNGKPAAFTPKELETFNFAIRDISRKLNEIVI